MAKYIAAVVKNRNGTCTVLKCQNGDDKEKGVRHGSIIERIYVPTYGRGLQVADQIEGK